MIPYLWATPIPVLVAALWFGLPWAVTVAAVLFGVTLLVLAKGVLRQNSRRGFWLACSVLIALPIPPLLNIDPGDPWLLIVLAWLFAIGLGARLVAGWLTRRRSRPAGGWRLPRWRRSAAATATACARCIAGQGFAAR